MIRQQQVRSKSQAIYLTINLLEMLIEEGNWGRIAVLLLFIEELAEAVARCSNGAAATSFIKNNKFKNKEIMDKQGICEIRNEDSQAFSIESFSDKWELGVKTVFARKTNGYPSCSTDASLGNSQRQDNSR